VKYKAVVTAIVCLLAGGQVSAQAQADGRTRVGTVMGRVTDVETKVPVAGATAQLVNTTLGSVVDADGLFQIEHVPVGTYSLRVSCVGYEPKTHTDVIVRSDRITVVNEELTMTPLEFDTVQVTAGYFAKVQDQPTSATNFTGEEIRRAPGSAGDVSRILAVLPSIAKVNDMINSLVVRGGSPTENAFFVDNIEIPNINHYPVQGTSGGPIGLLNVDFIDDVNFSAGGFSAAYGDRLSSVMEITFREGNRYAHDFQLDMNFAGLGVAAEGPIAGGRGSYMGSVRRSYLDLLVDAIGTGVAPRYSDYQGKVVYDLAPAHQVSLLGVYGHDRIEFDRETSVEDALPFYGPFNGYEYAGGVNWRWLWGKKGYSNTSVSMLGTKYDQNVYETFMPDTLDPWVYTNQSLEQTAQVRNVNHYRISDRLSTEFGGDVKYFYNDFEQRSAPYTNSVGDPIAAMAVDKSLDATKYGAFLNLVLRPTVRATATVGARFDYSPFNERSHVAPRFALTYKATDRLTLKGASGIYYQSIPLALVVQKQEFEALADPVAYHYIVGADYLLTGDTKLTLETYYKKYDRFPMDPAQPMLFLADELSFQRIVGVFDSLTDGGRAESYGVEATVQKKLARNVYGLVSGALFRARYEGLDGVWRNRIFDNRYLFTVEGGYKPNNRWEFSVRWIFGGGPPYSEIDPVASAQIGRTVFYSDRANTVRYPDYHSLNLRVDRRYHFRRTNLIAYLSIWNVYNRQNVSMRYWNVAEQKIDDMLQWSFLPVAGLEFEF